MDDLENVALGDSKGASDGESRLAFGVSPPNLPDGFGCEFGAAIVVANPGHALRSESLFANRVSGVIGMSSKEEMISPAAEAVVAAMADEHSLRNRADFDLVNESMSVRPSFSALSDPDPSISTVAFRARPEPASSGSADAINPAVQALFEGSSLSWHVVERSK